MKLDLVYESLIRAEIARHVTRRNAGPISTRMRKLGAAGIEPSQVLWGARPPESYLDEAWPASWDGPFCAAVGDSSLIFLRAGLAQGALDKADADYEATTDRIFGGRQ